MSIPFELVFQVAFQAVKLPVSLVIDEEDEQNPLILSVDFHIPLLIFLLIKLHN